MEGNSQRGEQIWAICGCHPQEPGWGTSASRRRSWKSFTECTLCILSTLQPCATESFNPASFPCLQKDSLFSMSYREGIKEKLTPCLRSKECERQRQQDQAGKLGKSLWASRKWWNHSLQLKDLSYVQEVFRRNSAFGVQKSYEAHCQSINRWAIAQFLRHWQKGFCLLLRGNSSGQATQPTLPEQIYIIKGPLLSSV